MRLAEWPNQRLGARRPAVAGIARIPAACNKSPCFSKSFDERTSVAASFALACPRTGVDTNSDRAPRRDSRRISGAARRARQLGFGRAFSGIGGRAWANAVFHGRRFRPLSKTALVRSAGGVNDRGRSAQPMALTLILVPGRTLASVFTSPSAFAQTLQGLASRVSSPFEIGVRPKPMAMA